MAMASIDDIFTRIYIDHDVMHGATFPVYDFQKFLTHPFAAARRAGGSVDLGGKMIDLHSGTAEIYMDLYGFTMMYGFSISNVNHQGVNPQNGWTWTVKMMIR